MQQNATTVKTVAVQTVNSTTGAITTVALTGGETDDGAIAQGKFWAFKKADGTITVGKSRLSKGCAIVITFDNGTTARATVN